MGIDPASLALIIGAVASVATAGAGVASSLQKPPAPPKLPKPVGDEAKTAQIRAAEEERKRAAAAKSGQSSTILTSPLGEETVQPGASSLLGT